MSKRVKPESSSYSVNVGDTAYGLFGQMTSNVPSDYWQSLADQVAGTEYQQLFDLNPWRTQTYRKTWLQDLLGQIGFRTGFDKFQQNQLQASNDYDAKLAQYIQQNEYNSPLAQAQRMKQAGQNPDLLGTSGVSEAGQMPETPIPEIPDDFSSDPMAFAQGVMSIVMSGIAFAKDFQSLQSIRQTVDSQNIKNAKGYYDLALQVALNSTSGLPSDESISNAEESHRSYLSERGMEYMNTLPKRMRKSFFSAYGDVIRGIPFEKERFKSWKETVQNYHQTAIGVGSKYYSGDWQQDLFKVSDELSKLVDKIEKTGYENKASYQEEINPELQAQSENMKNQASYEANQVQVGENGLIQQRASAESATYGEQAQNRTMTKEINSTLSSIVHSLSENAKKGDVFAQGILLLFSIARLANFSGNLGNTRFSF